MASSPLHGFIMRRLLTSVLLSLLSVTAHAQLYSDWWWNPDQSGQGINVGQEGNIAFMAWFTYDEGGDGMWLVMGGPMSGASLDADLYRTTGPALGSTYNANAVVATKVGHGTLAFADTFNAIFTWAVNGKSGSLALVRETFGAPALSGLYRTATRLMPTVGCGPGLGGLEKWTNSFTTTDTTLANEQVTPGKFNFHYSAPLVRQGRWLTSQGTYTGGDPAIPFQGGPYTLRALPIDNAVYFNETQGSSFAACNADIEAMGLK